MCCDSADSPRCLFDEVDYHDNITDISVARDDSIEQDGFSECDFFALLGLLSLAGVIINNGIVLLDRIDSVRAEGGDAYTAIIDAAITRLRPILMATVTTILGLMPLILSQDTLFYSMAINMAFGLAFGTVLTLGVVPALSAGLLRS